jgi:hypothetical protein
MDIGYRWFLIIFTVHHFTHAEVIIIFISPPWKAFLNQLRNNCVIIPFHFLIQLKLYMIMKAEENKIDITPAIYVIIMVVVFSLAI